MSEEELIKRFNDLNIKIIHLQSQFDQLLQSFNIYSNLQAEVRSQKENVDGLKNVLDSSITSFNSISSEIIDIKMKVEKHESTLYSGQEIKIFNYEAPPSEDCEGCKV